MSRASNIPCIFPFATFTIARATVSVLIGFIPRSKPNLLRNINSGTEIFSIVLSVFLRIKDVGRTKPYGGTPASERHHPAHLSFSYRRTGSWGLHRKKRPEYRQEYHVRLLSLQNGTDMYSPPYVVCPYFPLPYGWCPCMRKRHRHGPCPASSPDGQNQQREPSVLDGPY